MDLREATVIAERIRATIAATVIFAGGTALSRADHALYAAKSAGRNRVYAANGSSPHLVT